MNLRSKNLNYIKFFCYFIKKIFNFNFVVRFGKLVYAGISHLHLILQKAKNDQNLDHKVFENVRAGDWLIKYTFDRLKDSKGLSDLANFLLVNIYPLYTMIPAHLKPHYLIRIIDALYNYFIKYLFSKIEESMDLADKGTFFKSLLIANLQFIGFVESSKFKDKSNNIIQSELSISAGLPFFSTEYMRCWGRDTFISLKGLLLIPGFYKEAKQIIIHFASTMRHGLIPNLLDSGNNPRFNARDAVWFFLQVTKILFLFYLNF
jgi:glycogen debranching enzyme